MNKNIDKGRINLGTWAQRCLEDVEHWPSALESWARSKGCYPASDKTLKYVRLAEFFVSAMPPQYDYLLQTRERARLREIFQWRLKKEGDKILGTPAEEWLAAFQHTQFLYIYRGETIHRIGSLPSDALILSDVICGFFNPLSTFPTE